MNLMLDRIVLLFYIKKACWYACIIIMTQNRIRIELGIEQTEATVRIACIKYKKEENIIVSFVHLLQIAIGTTEVVSLKKK